MVFQNITRCPFVRQKYFENRQILRFKETAGSKSYLVMSMNWPRVREQLLPNLSGSGILNQAMELLLKLNKTHFSVEGQF
jgi:hypothetical protein